MQRSGLAIIISVLFVASVVVGLYLFARPLHLVKTPVVEKKVETVKDVIALTFPLAAEDMGGTFVGSAQKVEVPVSPDPLSATQLQKLVKESGITLTAAQRKTLGQSYVLSVDAAPALPVFVSVEQVLAGYQSFWQSHQEMLKVAIKQQAFLLNTQTIEKITPKMEELAKTVNHSFFDVSLTRLQSFFQEVQAGTRFDSKNLVLETKEDLKDEILYCYLLTSDAALWQSWQHIWRAQQYVGILNAVGAQGCGDFVKKLVGQSGTSTVEISPAMVDSLWGDFKRNTGKAVVSMGGSQEDVKKVKQSLKDDIAVISAVIPSDSWLKKNTRLINEDPALPVSVALTPAVLQSVFVEPAVHVYDSMALHAHYVLSTVFADIPLDKGVQYDLQKWSDMAVKLKEVSLSELQGRSIAPTDTDSVKMWLSSQVFSPDSYTDVVLLFALHNEWNIAGGKMLK